MDLVYEGGAKVTPNECDMAINTDLLELESDEDHFNKLPEHWCVASSHGGIFLSLEVKLRIAICEHMGVEDAMCRLG